MFQKLVELNFFWPFMRADIVDEMKNCNFCRLKRRNDSIRDVEYHRKTIQPVNHTVFLDIFHAAKNSASHYPILTMMCGTSRFAKAIALSNISAREISRAFAIHWVANFGAPVEVYTDQGTNFCSTEFRQYLKIEGIAMRNSVAHSHQSNSVERFHRSFLEILRAAINSSDARPVSMDDWNDLSLSVCTAYNSIEHSSTGISPFEMMNGRKNPLVLAKFCTEPALSFKNVKDLTMQRIAVQQNLLKKTALRVQSYTAPVFKSPQPVSG